MTCITSLVGSIDFAYIFLIKFFTNLDFQYWLVRKLTFQVFFLNYPCKFHKLT